MKTRILLLIAFVALGAGCKGNKDATATSPGNVTVGTVDQLNNREYRQTNSARFLDDSHELRKLVQGFGTDPRVLSARLRTDRGYRGAKYDLKLAVQDQYGQIIPFRMKGNMRLQNNMSGIDLIGLTDYRTIEKIGQLNSIVDVKSNESCVFISLKLIALGQTSMILCDESYDDDRYDRDDRYRRDHDRR